MKIQELRPGANGSNKEAPNFANYDESKVKPYSALPDPLTLKNGKKVTSAKAWWNQRRAEIVEDFDREMYGRMPKVTPKVNWEVVSSTNETKYDVPVVTKQRGANAAVIRMSESEMTDVIKQVKAGKLTGIDCETKPATPAAQPR